MVIKHYLVGYANFCAFLETFKPNTLPVHLYFTGSKLPSGESWCPDCVKAWPVVEKELANLPECSHFIIVDVGDRETWKDPRCSFRTDSRTKLMVIPTLKRWNGHQKLEGEQCENAELIYMLLTDEDD